MTRDEEENLSFLREYMILCAVGIIFILSTLLAVKRMWTEAILFPIGASWAASLVAYYLQRLGCPTDKP